jgi:hypothetical protein
MKKIVLSIGLLLTLLIITSSKINAQADEAVNFDYFYNELQPYGTWIQLNDNIVGWKPNIDYPVWSPYSRGTWAWTNNGWYWDSQEPFGYIVYHYGRWHYDDYYGWLWFPDYTWAPAWVEWRNNDDYIGWAPLPPYAGFSISAGMTFGPECEVPYHYWSFVKFRYFCSPNIYGHFVSTDITLRVFSSTTTRVDYAYRDKAVFNNSVDPSFVETHGGIKVRQNQIEIHERENSPGTPIIRTKGRIQVYTPTTTAIVTDHNYNFEQGERETKIDVSKLRIDERITRNTPVEKNENITVNKNEERTNNTIVNNNNRVVNPPNNNIVNNNPTNNIKQNNRTNKHAQTYIHWNEYSGNKSNVKSQNQKNTNVRVNQQTRTAPPPRINNTPRNVQSNTKNNKR